LVQATAVFVTVGHGLFVLCHPSMRRNRGLRMAVLSLMAASLLPALIWYLAMRQAWAHDIVINRVTFALTLRTGIGFFKDLSGGGLICTLLLFTGALYGYLDTTVSRPRKNLLGMIFLATICGALGADVYAGYFSSPRQAIYCLLALLPLAAIGWERLHANHRPAAFALLGVFVAISLAKDVSLVRSRENWPAASRMLAAAARDGFCIQPVAGETSPLPLYSFFEPSLADRRCAGNDTKVGLVYSVFTPRADSDKDSAALAGRGFARAGSDAVGGSIIERYVKPVTSFHSETH
jgi:hypothetical protein